MRASIVIFFRFHPEINVKKKFVKKYAHHTVLEDTLHVESIGSTCLVVAATFELPSKLAGLAVINKPGIGWSNRICTNITAQKICNVIQTFSSSFFFSSPFFFYSTWN